MSQCPSGMEDGYWDNYYSEDDAREAAEEYAEAMIDLDERLVYMQRCLRWG